MSDRDRHPETALVPYVKGELASGERARVATHLDGCERCRAALADVRAVLAALAASPTALEPPWGRYRAELRERLTARAVRWWQRPLPIAVSAGLAAALLLFALQPAPVQPPTTNLAQIEETALGARLDMVEHYDVVARLDMLDALDDIRQLDVVPVRGR
ncbi:MAG TPA: zf-HC2 domain-containing protein [Methylomirabilota bacterium]|jgi:anti-sigma factor RsiW